MKIAVSDIPKSPRFLKLGLSALAVVFAGATFLYSALWIYNNSWEPSVELGYHSEYVPREHCQYVTKVDPDSPAEQAGLRPGDKILNIAGQDLNSSHSLADAYAQHHPGDRVQMTVDCAAIKAPVVMTGVFRAHRPQSKEGELTEHLRAGLGKTFPVAFLLVGLAVLFLRVEDPNAWLLALMFAGFIATPSLPGLFHGVSPPFRPFALAYRAIFNSLLGPLFYFFFAVFPARSPLDRRVAWLKWVGLGLGAFLVVPGLGLGEGHAPMAVVRITGERGANTLWLTFNYGFLALGLYSLISNAAGASTPEARRKLRVILLGALVGVVPAAGQAGASDIFGFHLPLLLSLTLILLLFLFPLSFAYAVVKHRVLEIPVLLKRSARYLAVQRGFTILLSLVSIGATVAFARSFAHYLGPLMGAALPSGIALGTCFGTLLLWTGTQVHRRAGRRIDRAFFRNAYDARQVLENLAHNTRKAKQRQQLAALLESEINQALHPASIAVYLEASDGRLKIHSGTAKADFDRVLAPDLPWLEELQCRGEPVEVQWEPSKDGVGVSELGVLQPECLVPLLSPDGKLIGVVMLGVRLSDEPYSREDRRLLASVASQAALTLEAIRLGEEIAGRIDAERRSAQEMEFAREVQSRLFPQKFPALATLDYTGACFPTRQVGGDYFDFLELRPGRVALVLADIAGKGISGALLMANLQANLRSQYAMALEDLPRLLRSVNHLFFENTTESSYATLFFADYDDSTRRLRYVNCGHLAPLLLRAGGGQNPAQPQIERLGSTATVVGLFAKWECCVAETLVAPGDTLVLYTDGVTEAANAAEEEFGESRLVETLLAHQSDPVASLLQTVVAKVQDFSRGEQADDITLVIARCRPLLAIPDAN
jgi:phosphoserine phosphatase RsbU/P